MKGSSKQFPLRCLVAVAMISGCLAACSEKKLSDVEYVVKAKVYLDSNKSKEAAIELKNALGVNPKNAEARWLLGALYVENEQGAPAEKELQRAQELGVAAESIKIPLARAYLLQGKLKHVLDEIHPGSQATARSQAQILKMRGDALLGLRQGKEACAAYAESNQKDAEYVEAYRGLALCAAGLDKDAKHAEELLTQALQLIGRALAKSPSDFESLMLKGEIQRSMDKVEEAAASFGAALGVRPNHVGAHLNSAAILIGKDKLDEAREHISKARKVQPQNVTAIYMAALVEFRQGKLEQARDSLQQALKLVSGHLPSLSLFGAVSLSLGSYEQAERALSYVLAQSPRDAYARKLLSATQLKQGKPSLAIDTLGSLLPQTTDVQILGLAGEIHMALKQPKKASEFFEQAIRTTPDNTALETEFALSRMMTGDVSAGIAVLEKASMRDPKQTQADGALIATYIQLREYGKALVAIDSLDKKQPGSALVHNLRGGVYLSMRDTVNARKNLEKALAIDPAFVSAAKNLAQLDLMDKRPNDARKRFHDVLAKERNDIEAMLALADLAAAEHNDTEYLQWVEKAAKAAPKVMEPQTRLVNYYLGKKETQKALGLARTAQSEHSTNPRAWELLGRTQFAVGEKENAVTSFTEVTQLEPRSAGAYYDLGAAQASVGRTPVAQAMFVKALEMNSDHLESRRALIGLKLAQSLGAEAQRLAEEQSRRHPDSPAGPVLEGDVLIAQKQFSRAAKTYARAFSLTKTAQLAITVQQAMLLAGDAKGGDGYLTAWLKDHPDDVPTRVFLADSLRVRRDPASIGQYELALQKAPGNVSILNNLAIAYGDAKNPRALGVAEKAYQLAPDNPGVQDTLGWILAEQGNLPRALEILKKAAAKALKEGTIRYHYAVALARSGAKAEAKKELEAILADGQKFPEIQEAKAMLKSL